MRGGTIDIGLQRNALATATAFVGGDHHARSAILDASGKRFGREAAEHHRMDRPDPRARQHRERRLRNHRQIDRHTVALGDALRLQHIGEGADLGMEVAIGEAARVCGRVIGFPDQGDVVAALRQMPVEAIGRDVQFAVGEPVDVEIGLVERPVARDLRPLDPIEPPRLFEPKAARIGERATIERFIPRRIVTRPRGPFGRHGIEVLVGHAAHSSARLVPGGRSRMQASLGATLVSL